MDEFDQERHFDALLKAGSKGFDAGWNTLADEINGILRLPRLEDNERIRLIKATAMPLNRNGKQ